MDSARAISEARHLLEHLDAMEWEQVWEAGTLLFKTRYNKEDWIALRQVRQLSYGALLSREFRSLNSKPSFYFSPDGHYVIVQFTSAFMNKQKTVETVVLDASNPANWKVVDIRLN